MITHLMPKDGPVVAGLEDREVVYAKDQPQYLPLRTLVSHWPERGVLSRWSLTDEQRKAIAEGADIFLELLTFGQPLPPIMMFLADDAGAACNIGLVVPEPARAGTGPSASLVRSPTTVPPGTGRTETTVAPEVVGSPTPRSSQRCPECGAPLMIEGTEIHCRATA